MNPSASGSGSRRKFFPALIALFCLALILLLYLLMVIVRGLAVYDWITKPPEPMDTAGRYIGQAFTVDPVLGPVLNPNGEGGWLIFNGDPVPFRHDAAGLRIPVGGRPSWQAAQHPRLLFLGDSFTYGELVAAEHTFAFKAAAKLHGESINGGMPGHGLAQMVLLARKLIPKHKPDYVVVQYSPWLVTRSQSEFFTGTGQLVMAPYFSDSGDGVVVSPAAFVLPSGLMTRFEKYKASPPGLAEKISFLGSVALPLFVDRDLGLLSFRIKQWLRLAPRYSQRSDEIVRAAYAEIDGIAKENGAKAVILALGAAEPLNVPEQLFPVGIASVNGWRALVEKLDPRTSDEYVSHYFLARGSPLVSVDGHPNEWAHEIIADAVAERIRRLEAQKR